MIAATTSSPLVRAVSNVASTRPSRIAMMWSVSDMTSAMLWLMSTTVTPLVAHAPDDVVDLTRLPHAQGGRRLVEQQDASRPDEGAGDRHGLSLPAGQV